MQFPWWWSAFAPLGAYFGGIITKPLADAVSRRIELKRIRSGLYAELAHNYSSLLSYQLNKFQQTATWGLYPGPESWERREVFERTQKDSPALFAELSESTFFTYFYLRMTGLKALDRVKQHQAVSDLVGNVDSLVRSRTLSRPKLRKAIQRLGGRPTYALQNPIRRYCWVKYHLILSKVTNRNVPEVPPGTPPGWQYMSTTPFTLLNRLKAIWTGVPGELKLAPCPIGPQLTGLPPEQSTDIRDRK